MKEKKFMIPIILGVLLLCGIVFTVVYKTTSGTNPNEIREEQTLAPKETKPIKTKVVEESDRPLEDFEINEELREKTLDDLGGGVVIVTGDIEESSINNENTSIDNEESSINNEDASIDNEDTNINNENASIDNENESSETSETLSNEDIESIREQYLDWQITVYKEDDSYEELFTPEEIESIEAETAGDISMYYLPN